MQKYRYADTRGGREHGAESERKKRKGGRKRVESSGWAIEAWAPARCMLIGEQVLGLGAGG